VSRTFNEVKLGEMIGAVRVISEPFRIMRSQMRTCIICECFCGKEFIANLHDLQHGHYQSCGCKKYELIGNKKRTHGESYGSTDESGKRRRTPEYHIWDAMKQRCRNPKDKNYLNYGGRGIMLAECWNRYEQFIADVGRRPGPNYSLERNNVNGNYEPSNCRWATTWEQSRNRRDNRFVTYKNETMCVTDWSERTGISVATISDRLDRGWDIEKALTQCVPSHLLLPPKDRPIRF